MPSNVVVAGGGIAGLEGLLAIRDLAGDRVRLTLVSPDPEFELKQLRTAEPFSVDHVRRYSLAEVCHAHHAEFVRDTVESVDVDGRTVALAESSGLAYDSLVVAVGARSRPPFSRALTFGADRDTSILSGLLSDLEQGFSRSAAFVVPPGVSWPLPLYELALMTAREVRSMGMDGVELQIVTPEHEPLALFGSHASGAIVSLLQEAGIVFRGGVSVEGAGDVDAERIVTIPLIEGHALGGLPHDERGFIPVDGHGRVHGLHDVYAAGDAADYPIKQGGLACQQADAVARLLASEAGAAVDPMPFSPVLRGKLLTGAGAWYLRHAPRDEEGRFSDVELWFPPAKVSGHYLSQWLEYADAAQRHAEREEHVDVEVPLPTVARR